MTTQLPLFRATDPTTSRTAARSVDVARSHEVVLAAFREHGTMDDRRLVALTAGVISDSRARGARNELARLGMLEVCGTTGTPPRRVWRRKQT